MSQGNNSSIGAEVLSASKKFSCPIGQNLADLNARTLLPSMGTIAYDSVARLLYFGGGMRWIPTNDIKTTAVYAEFYALMPGDNPSTVSAGTPVEFPQVGSNSGNGITNLTTSTFQIADLGTYEVSWQVSVTEAGQLVLFVEAGSIVGMVGTGRILRTVVGRATGTSQITNTTIIQTSSVNTVISVHNPGPNMTALTITPNAGGTLPVSANLVIRKID